MALTDEERETRNLLAQYAETIASMLRRIGPESNPIVELEHIGADADALANEVDRLRCECRDRTRRERERAEADEEVAG